MGCIEYLGGSVLYENPKPHVHSRHGYFPGILQLGSGELLALFMIAEAFEAPNGTTWISRSSDSGKTWRLEGPLCAKPPGVETTDTLKATQLRSGRLIAMGYRFHRHDPEQGIGIEATGGILPGDDIVSFSDDEGRTWSPPEVILRSRPELLEISGPCLQTRAGQLLATSAPYKMPDGSNPSGQIGVLLRSRDEGRHWDDGTLFFEAQDRKMTPLESRICAMEDGRLVAIAWAYDYTSDRHFANHVTVSHDDGATWSRPIDTGHMGQASNLIALEGDLLLSIHAHRGDEIGIYVRLVEFRNDCWRTLEEQVIYGAGGGPQTRPGQEMTRMFTSVRFGQPSLVRLQDGGILAAHWCIEEGQGKIRIHHLRLNAR